MTTTQMIAHLNDLLRLTGMGGKTVLSAGIAALSESDQFSILRKVRDFNDFSEDNDPHHERDFGSFMFGGNKIFWKIDYYDTQYVNQREKLISYRG